MFKITSGTAAVLATLLLSTSLTAVETRVWSQSETSDFSRAKMKGLSLSSDGHLTVAPRLDLLDSTTIPYLWAVARSHSGDVYYAGGSPTGATTKIVVLPKNGKPRLFAELPGLEIHSLALDSNDRLYAAVQPDAKIYRISEAGHPVLFFDTKAKYVWQMLFDRENNLYAATGDGGLLLRISPDGKGKPFFRSEQTHVRSITFDRDGNLIAGTEPGGLVIRITPSGQSFVLYETARREVTSVAASAGYLYALSVGSKKGPAVISGVAPVLPSSAPATTPAGAPRPTTAPPAALPPVGSFTASVIGGSELDRIAADGAAERLWESGSDVGFALAFDANSKPLIASGDSGILYRIDSPTLATQAVTVPPSQITALLPADNRLYLATGNGGNLYLLDNQSGGDAGTLTSDVFDAHGFSDWGKMHLDGKLQEGQATLETRSGNLENPDTFWSEWAKVSLEGNAGQVPSPPARFLQYRLTLRSGQAAQSVPPEIISVDTAYMQRNEPPRVRLVETAPFNYRETGGGGSLERSANASGSPLTLTVAAVGQRRTSLPSAAALEAASAATLQYAKGFLTVRWAASDSNDDPLEFKVELQRTGDKIWTLLRDHVTDRFFSFDTTAFVDGKYAVRITATDAPGNVPGAALTSQGESDPFSIDNTPPVIDELKSAGTKTSFTAHDAISWINKTEFSVDGGPWLLLNPVGKVTDSRSLHYELDVQANHIRNGQTVAVRVFDDCDNVQVRQLTASSPQ